MSLHIFNRHEKRNSSSKRGDKSLTKKSFLPHKEVLKLRVLNRQVAVSVATARCTFVYKNDPCLRFRSRSVFDLPQNLPTIFNSNFLVMARKKSIKQEELLTHHIQAKVTAKVYQRLEELVSDNGNLCACRLHAKKKSA